jgi:beta-glucanase (GH16 family)
VTTSSLPGGTVSTVYSTTLSATGGTSPYTWSLASGTLPAGLTLSSSGVISGTPTAAATSSFSVTAQDSASSPQAATQALSIAVVAKAASTLSPPPQAAGYTLQFSDDFSPLSLSPNGSGNYTWFSPGIWWDGTTTYGNISASNGLLTLNWVNGQSTGDTSIATASPNGCSSSQPCGTWRYGYFEASMAWTPVSGAWPAFWMIPKQQVQNASNMGEIDIFEGQGNTPNTYYGTYHEWQNGTTDVNNNSNSNSWNLPSGTSFTSYHTYGLLWTPGNFTWYFDNQPILSASYSGTTGASWFDNNDFYIILGSQVNGWGSNTGASGTIPLNVQWVHVWQSTPLN